jgi:2'-5' RNA ligase
MVTTIRSFIAMELEDLDTINNIQAFYPRLMQNQPNLKVVKSENLHMTVKFLGDIPDSLAPKIYEILCKEVNENLFQGKTLEYQLKGVGQFNKHSVIWIKLVGNVHFLQNVKDTIENSLSEKLSIERDNRPKFKPHLTIGRLRKNKINYKTFESFKNLLRDNRDLEFGAFKINQVKLKKSVLTPKGPIYSDLVY